MPHEPEEEPRQDVWLNSRAFATEFRVVWNPPKASASFEFPKCEITVTHLDVETNEKKTFRQFTGSHEKYDDMMKELISMALHPSMRDFVNRAIFNQWYFLLKHDAEYAKWRARYEKVRSRKRKK